MNATAKSAFRVGFIAMLGLAATEGWAVTAEFIHTDALGSVVAVTDSNRVIIERREYEPFGEQLTPAVQNGPGYTGHVQDAATGLTYMQQRYYDATVGRFLSVDPVTADGNTGENFNRYWYARNSPFTYVDPDGRKEKPFVAGVEAPRVAKSGTTTLIDPRLPNYLQTGPYNCHSYAWHGGQGDRQDPSNKGGLPNWDNSPEDDMRDAERLDSQEPNRVGDIVVYGEDLNSNGRLEGLSEIDHSAIVIAVDSEGNTIRVEGKEGQGPITNHHPSDQDPLYRKDKEWFRVESKQQ